MPFNQLCSLHGSLVFLDRFIESVKHALPVPFDHDAERTRTLKLLLKVASGRFNVLAHVQSQ
jgi:hypothetical protein